MPHNAIINVDLGQYLILANRGTAFGVGFTVGAGTPSNPTVVNAQNAPILPLQGDAGLYVDFIQFDGVSSGQVGFSFTFGRHIVKALAVQGIPFPIGLAAQGPLQYQVESAQTTTCVVNIALISLSDDTMQRDIQTLLADLAPGGTFGDVRVRRY